MRLKYKFLLSILFSLFIILSSNVVFADEAPAMPLIENGVVSGDVSIATSNPFSESGSLHYEVPENVSEIRSVHVVVGSYSGSGAPTYALYSNVTLNTKDGLVILGFEDLYCDRNMANDPVVYRINDHTTKQYSDYQSLYDITNYVKNLSSGDKITISVVNSKKPGYEFDGRIKLIALVFAYDDGDGDEISYWLNIGQSWTQSTRSNIINTKDFNGKYDKAYFENIALSSYHARCWINNNILYDPIKETDGSYFIYDMWDITDSFIPAQNTDFTYSASASGYGSFKSNVQLLRLVFLDKPDINVDAPDLTKYKGSPDRFIVNVTDKNGNPIANQSVVITLNGVSYTRVTDKNGIAGMNINFAPGVYKANVKVESISVNSTITVLTTVNGTNVTKMFKNGTQYYATFRDINGNYLADGSEVTFNINGVMYHRKVNGTQGLARLNINLDPGEYTLTAINPNSSEMSSNFVTVLAQIAENNDLVKYFRNDSQYRVKVLDTKGNAVGANETVVFNINGVMYKRLTDASGYAKLNINLDPGKYIITAMYGDSMVSNNITVKPILTASDLTKKYGVPGQFKANLVDGQGKPNVGQNVTFNINGVFYERETDGNGTAALNINLNPGVYIITSSYSAASIGNTVTVTE